MDFQRLSIYSWIDEGRRPITTNKQATPWEDQIYLGSTLHPGEEEAE